MDLATDGKGVAGWRHAVLAELADAQDSFPSNSSSQQYGARWPKPVNLGCGLVPRIQSRGNWPQEQRRDKQRRKTSYMP